MNNSRGPPGDGLVFDVASISGEEIRAADEYDGVRVRLLARLAEARIPVHVDVGFGDAVVPEPEFRSYPTLLDHEAPRVLVYPPEAVVAEKLEAIVSLGLTISRMKDFYDLQRLSGQFAFDAESLTLSIRTTFERRGTPLPADEPLALSRDFLTAPERQTQWRAFLRRGRLEDAPDAAELADTIAGLVLPVLQAAFLGESFRQTWAPADRGPPELSQVEGTGDQGTSRSCRKARRAAGFRVATYPTTS
ncbi:MAG: nucleotidyl transferase AbiEii/AbiGii toxin family protein [Vicinamibacterales bacterium]